MNLQLTGKSALITGATAGIGLAIAKTLFNEGVKLIIPGRNQQKLEQAAITIAGKLSTENITLVIADLGTEAGVQQLQKQIPQIDILVNNLGIYEAKSFFDLTDSDWLNLFEINVMSGVRLARHYLPGMLERNDGRIIFISSEAGIMTPPEMIHYGMTKSAQLAIARGLAELTQNTAVTVNSILPGPTRSEGIGEFLRSMSTQANPTPSEAEQEFFVKHRTTSLLQRLIDPQEIANLVAYVASPLSAATNGAALRAEGGLLRTIY